jgi:hypothetical protein
MGVAFKKPPRRSLHVPLTKTPAYTSSPLDTRWAAGDADRIRRYAATDDLRRRHAAGGNETWATAATGHVAAAPPSSVMNSRRFTRLPRRHGRRDELAPLHSITSSARASSIGGTSKPSALAVLRLITN